MTEAHQQRERFLHECGTENTLQHYLEFMACTGMWNSDLHECTEKYHISTQHEQLIRAKALHQM